MPRLASVVGVGTLHARGRAVRHPKYGVEMQPQSSRPKRRVYLLAVLAAHRFLLGFTGAGVLREQTVGHAFVSDRERDSLVLNARSTEYPERDSGEVS